jgi:hypothetical protein
VPQRRHPAAYLNRLTGEPPAPIIVIARLRLSDELLRVDALDF